MSPDVWLGVLSLLLAVAVGVDMPLVVAGHPYGSRSAKRTAPHQQALGTDRREPSPPPAGPPRRRREAWTIAAGVAVTLAVVVGASFAGWQWQAEAQADLDRIAQEDQP